MAFSILVSEASLLVGSRPASRGGTHPLYPGLGFERRGTRPTPSTLEAGHEHGTGQRANLWALPGDRRQWPAWDKGCPELESLRSSELRSGRISDSNFGRFGGPKVTAGNGAG
ncbi:hypothetical protein CMUS01_00572 [Colletotrichum musicola]|uniref:Uncharacterized protein n=1 Tax=Colletotrichum musicola TaxID=2175873 RepID=A0A8H6NYJ5_9PEZI|nr:hypothetical protein CMUS01_00572 [Colletotrichum musicola]